MRLWPTTYSQSQIDALERALLVASGFVLVGLWFACSPPVEALARDEGEERLPADLSAVDEAMA
ncbi:MAG TPA: hypothetical protein VNX67_09260 [Solirubrobacteraceae bacterium]|jgi:hypothetical protein|nr:hypothetical protein [Solirubrobacteraceae bacterium]